jgi:hypothetical protein
LLTGCSDCSALNGRGRIIFFSQFGCLLVHQSFGVAFQLVQARQRLAVRLPIIVCLSSLIDPFGLEYLLVVAGVAAGLLFHALFLLPTELLLVVCEGGGEEEGGSEVAVFFAGLVHVGVDGPAIFELLRRHTLLILCGNIKIIAG